MRRLTALFSVALLVGLPLGAASSVEAEPRRNEQGEVRKDMREGQVRSLREIERQVLPAMSGMQYLGPEYDPAAMAYRLKFIRDGRVVFVGCRRPQRPRCYASGEGP